MALPLKHLLPSRNTALHASWITLTVLVLLLSAAVLMTMGKLKETSAYWQVLVEVALVLLSVQWLLTATWVQVGTHRCPWSKQAILTPLTWLNVTSVLYVTDRWARKPARTTTVWSPSWWSTSRAWFTQRPSAATPPV
ncbi:TPA: hypothetical protein NJF89_006035 [Pseudomonas aeruginosa]|uniref:hypothetical protein n=1 Tax=Pseudomonas aeruginosa TaxID=287 RepID=UPI0019138BA6|nr:hypothetical protein [Pseudomonas aeruginosa]MEB4807908.1 hypothetical protein [Pseudomonas aeruginosa]MEB4812943.1 hypothetical protein [Pseudomonas aeruginosa]MEB4877711.1 hypothetical protein [Pseudomonas aeruginosa]MEB4900004.1 hypothetical protein [Pseudomonas aeruginosa]MEB4917242.1 hypothetical protein [Pseudomonas aeruginosa]